MNFRHIVKLLGLLVLSIIEPLMVYAEEPPTASDQIKIGIVGDVMAQGVAQALTRQLKIMGNDQLVPHNFAKGSSGFVRNDYYDWNAALPPILDANKLDYMLIFMGSNDRQSIRIKGKSHKAKTPIWREEYVHRINSFLDVIKQRGVKAIWLGQPISRGRSFSNDMALFNEIYRQQVESHDGTYFDVWTLFADENGKYSRRGADVSGQIKTLRSSSGIHFTKNGYDKLAFQIIELIDKLENGEGVSAGSEEGELVDDEVYDLSENTGADTIIIGRRDVADPLVLERLAPIPNVFSNDSEAINDTDNEAEISLLTEFDLNLPLWKNVLEMGYIVDSEFGRSDDFSWPRN